MSASRPIQIENYNPLYLWKWRLLLVAPPNLGQIKMINSRTSCGGHKQSMITWALLTIFIELLCQVRETVGVKCFKCPATGGDVEQCYSNDSASNQTDCSSAGCKTEQIMYKDSNSHLFGWRSCLDQNYLDCFLSKTGLNMKDGRCLKTTVRAKTIGLVDACLKAKGRQAINAQGRKVDADNVEEIVFEWRFRTCKEDLCNNAKIWKPDQFKEEQARGGSSSLPAAAWLLVNIGITFFTVCPFHKLI